MSDVKINDAYLERSMIDLIRSIMYAGEDGSNDADNDGSLMIQEVQELAIQLSEYDVVIIDYELSTMCGQKINKEGTPHFMSPEFFNSGDEIVASFEIDIYAFGVTIYFILTGGHYPFEFDITSTHTSTQTRNHIKHIPDIVYQCIETDPASRPSLSTIIEYFT